MERALRRFSSKATTCGRPRIACASSSRLESQRLDASEFGWAAPVGSGAARGAHALRSSAPPVLFFSTLPLWRAGRTITNDCVSVSRSAFRGTLGHVATSTSRSVVLAQRQAGSGGPHAPLWEHRDPNPNAHASCKQSPQAPCGPSGTAMLPRQAGPLGLLASAKRCSHPCFPGRRARCSGQSFRGSSRSSGARGVRDTSCG